MLLSTGRRFGPALIALVGLLLFLVPTPASATTAATPADSSAPSGPPVVKNIPYGPVADTALILDAYPSDAATPAPVIIAIHGGGWRGGDKATFTPLSTGLANAGFVVFNINYTLDQSLGPAYPREVDDVTMALHWVQAHAAEYGGDPNRIGLFGGSAGAHLAAMLGVTANTATSQPVKAVAVLSGPYDLPPLRTYIHLLEEDPPTECAARTTCFSPTSTAADGLIALLGCDPLECPLDIMEKASPVTYVTRYSPPFYMANSSAETVPADQPTLMADRLRQEGVPSVVKIIPGADHSIAYLSKVAQPIVAFYRQYLAVDAPPLTGTPLTPLTTPASPPTTGVTGGLPPDDDGNGRLWRWLVIGISLLAVVIAIAFQRTRAPRH